MGGKSANGTVMTYVKNNANICSTGQNVKDQYENTV